MNVTFIGHLGSDATLKNENGAKFYSVNVAENQSYKNAKGERVERTQWISCILDASREKLAENLKKGQSVLVRGSLTPSVFKDKNGVYKAGLNVRISDIEFLPTQRFRLEGSSIIDNRTGEVVGTATPEYLKRGDNQPQTGGGDETENDLPFGNQ